MTNLELAAAILAKHREARRWADEAVAMDMLAQFGIDAGAEDMQAAHEPEPPPVADDRHEAQDASHG